MNRISREVPAVPAGLRGYKAGSLHGRGRSVNGDPVDREESLDLFARTRHSQTVASSLESDGPVKLGMISVGSTRPLRSGMDDLLSSTEGGKHDYDWLLTPPETPLFSSSDVNELHQSLAAGRSSTVRSVSINKPSRLSVSQSDNGPAKPVRSSSATRPSVSNFHSSYSSNTNRTSVLNTSTASVSSSRPSTPTSRPSVRSSLSTTRPIAGRSSTPAKTRPSSIASADKPRASTISSSDKSRPSHNPRPSTPTSRLQMSGNLNPPATRPSSRPSTPTRRTPVPASTSSVPASTSSVPARSSSVGRVPSSRNMTPSSRASSPSPRARPIQQPIVPPDFPLDAPPNLRTTLPDRPVSAGRSRPGAAVTMRISSEPAGQTNPPRRHSSPIVTRSRLPELSRKSQVHSNGHEAGPTEMNKGIPSRSSKPTSSAESTGFGRTISKKSLDMALRHMDIRQNMASIRGLPGNSLFPQSIRSGNPKGRLGRVSDSPSSVGSNGSENGNGSVRSPDHGHEAHGDNGRVMVKLSLESDIYESSRYDSLLLKEDLKNTNWLHSLEDKSDQSPIFDHRFELLPEPFSLI